MPKLDRALRFPTLSTPIKKELWRLQREAQQAAQQRRLVDPYGLDSARVSISIVCVSRTGIEYSGPEGWNWYQKHARERPGLGHNHSNKDWLCALYAVHTLKCVFWTWDAVMQANAKGVWINGIRIRGGRNGIDL